MHKNQTKMSIVQEPIAEFDTTVFTTAGTSLYLSEKAADVHFVFKSGERVPAHKNLLVAASDVFDTMFYGSVPEEGDVKIVDASADAFKEFLQFFYSTKVRLTMENVGDVMYLGNKYDVAECMDLCVKFLQLNLTANNVCKIFGLAIVHDRIELKDMCENQIINHTEEVLKSVDFLKCSKQVLERILKLDQFSCSEVDVFKACMSWIKNANEQNELTKEMVQEHLDNLFYEIRFRSMTLGEFVDILTDYESIFSKGELCEILQMIRNEEYEPKQFSGNQRAPLFKWNKNAVIICNRFYGFGQSYLIGNVDITQFTANKALLLGRIQCYSIYKNENYERFGTNVPVKVTISEVPDRARSKILAGKVIYNGKFHLKCNAETIIDFPAPILIRPEVGYKIQIDSTQSIWLDSVHNTEVKFSSDINVQFHCNSNWDSNKKGLIFKLFFNRVD